MLGPKCYGRKGKKEIKVRGVEKMAMGRDHTDE